MMFSAKIKIKYQKDMINIKHGQTWFNVAMQHVFRVNVVERRTHARNVEGHVPLLKNHLVAQIITQISAIFKIQN